MPDHASHHGYIANKDDYLKRLRRIEVKPVVCRR